MTPKVRLLVVHPEPKLAASVRKVAEALAYDVTILPDGERAIDRFVLSPFDVVVVEYFLPGRDGVTTIESIRWAPMGRQVRVILLAESEPEIAPLAALGARIDAIDTIVGTPSAEALEKALSRAIAPSSSVATAPAVRTPTATFDDETGKPGPVPDASQSPGAVPSKTMATRFDDESTVQGSAGVARAMLGPWTPGMVPPGTSPGALPSAKIPSLLSSSPDAAPLRDAGDERSASGEMPPVSTGMREGVLRPSSAASSSWGDARTPEISGAQLRPAEGSGGTKVARRAGLPEVPTAPERPERMGPERGGGPGAGPTGGEWRRDAGAIDEARAVEDVAQRQAEGAVAGRFEDTPFPELLVRLAEAKATGALVCRQDGTEARKRRETTNGEPPTKVVYLRAGVPSHVRSNLLDECLGQLLLRKKRIGKATLEESIRRTLAGDGLQGEILIDMGALSPIEVSETLAAQATEKLYDLFGWRQGSYWLDEGAGKEGGLPIEQPLPEIVYEGISAAMPATQLLDVLTPHLESFVVPDAQRLARFARVRLPAELRPVLAKIDGRVPLRVLLGAGGRPGAVAQMIYALSCLKAVRFEGAAHARGPKKQESESGVGPPPQRGVAPAGLLPAKPGAHADWEEDATAKQGRKADAVAAMRGSDPGTAPRDAPPVHRVPASVLEKLAEPSEPRPAPPAPMAPAPAAATPSDRPRELDQKVDRLFEAERHFRRGSRALERQRYEEALSAFVRAHELVPTEGEFLAYVGWSRFASSLAQGGGDPEGHELALTELAQAADLSPDLYVTHLLYARVLARLRRDGEARRAYERVLLLEPENAEARAALGR